MELPKEHVGSVLSSQIHGVKEQQINAHLKNQNTLEINILLTGKLFPRIHVSFIPSRSGQC